MKLPTSTTPSGNIKTTPTHFYLVVNTYPTWLCQCLRCTTTVGQSSRCTTSTVSNSNKSRLKLPAGLLTQTSSSSLETLSLVRDNTVDTGQETMRPRRSTSSIPWVLCSISISSASRSLAQISVASTVTTSKTCAVGGYSLTLSFLSSGTTTISRQQTNNSTKLANTSRRLSWMPWICVIH